MNSREQAGQSMDSGPADVMKAQLPNLAQDTNNPNSTNDIAIPEKGTDLAGEESESEQWEDLTEEFAPEAQLPNLAAQDTNNPNSTNDIVIPGKGTDPAGEESESEQWVDLAAVNIHVLVAGETFNTHETFIQKLKWQINPCSAESSNVILVFCPVVSQIGTDMEAAMARVTVNKPVILVFMHHCHHPSHMTNITVQPFRSNIEQVVHCAFHETRGLLECQENEQAVKAVRSTLPRFVVQLDMEQQPVGTQNAKRPNNTNYSELHRQSMESVGASLSCIPRLLTQYLPSPKKMKYSSLVKVHVLVAGETFCTHDTFIQRLELQIEQCSAKSCSVILVFCPVVSRIGTDMEAAMARVTEDKPVILVFMHHCHNPSHMTNITVQPSRRNIEQVVHCAFHETRGLLECQENDRVAAAVCLQLQRYK